MFNISFWDRMTLVLIIVKNLNYLMPKGQKQKATKKAKYTPQSDSL
jgi:hypothetical protein